MAAMRQKPPTIRNAAPTLCIFILHESKQAHVLKESIEDCFVKNIDIIVRKKSRSTTKPLLIMCAR